MKVPDARKALELYYANTEINSSDIKALFNCASSTATRLKKQVLEEMARLGIKTWRPNNVDIIVAYKVWMIDVGKLETKLTKLNKLKNANIL